MHKPTLSIFCFCSLMFLLTGGVWAQATGGGLKFSCASWNRIDGPPIQYLSGKPKQNETPEQKIERLAEVDVPEMTRSVIYEFKSGRQIGFYRTKRNEGGETTLDLLASVTVPAGWTRALFVFFPGKEKGTYRVYPLRDDRDHAPFGSYQFVNLTEYSLSGFLEREPIRLEPNGRSIIKLSGKEDRSLNFGVWTEIDGKKKWLQRNSLTYKPTKYLVYFFYGTKDGQGRLKVKSKGIVDFSPPPVVDGAEVPTDEGDES